MTWLSLLIKLLNPRNKSINFFKSINDKKCKQTIKSQLNWCMHVLNYY